MAASTSHFSKLTTADSTTSDFQTSTSDFQTSTSPITTFTGKDHF